MYRTIHCMSAHFHIADVTTPKVKIYCSTFESFDHVGSLPFKMIALI